MLQNRAVSHAGNTEDAGRENRVAGASGKAKDAGGLQKERTSPTVRMEAGQRWVKKLNWKQERKQGVW